MNHIQNLQEHYEILLRRTTCSWVLTDLAIHFQPKEDRLDSLLRAIEFENVDPIAYYSLADYYYDKEDFEHAIVYYNKSIELGFAQAYVRLYLITQNTEFLELGVRQDDPLCLYILGCNSASKKEWDKSEEYLQKCASLSRKFSSDEKLQTLLRLCEL